MRPITIRRTHPSRTPHFAWRTPLFVLLILCGLAAVCAVSPVLHAQQAAAAPSTDTDPVRSPDESHAAAPTNRTQQVTRSGSGFLLQQNVKEVSLNVTVIDGKGRIVPNLKKGDFRILEDNKPQTLISFQHADVPVSIGVIVDNSGSMYKKRPAVNKAALDLIEASNPRDEAFVVNFADEAYIDQDFTSSVAKLRQGLSHIEARGGTALYDAVVASADKLASDGKNPKQVIILITDGEDNASTLNLEQTIRRVQQLSGPVIYSIGLLFGDEMSRSEVHHARRALEMLSDETGGIAYFPGSLADVDEIAAEVARDIRSQYTLGYHSTTPSNIPGFRRISVTAQAKGHGKLFVRTRTGYFPTERPSGNPSNASPPTH